MQIPKCMANYIGKPILCKDIEQQRNVLILFRDMGFQLGDYEDRIVSGSNTSDTYTCPFLKENGKIYSYMLRYAENGIDYQEFMCQMSEMMDKEGVSDDRSEDEFSSELLLLMGG